jgi:hypothetical protein
VFHQGPGIEFYNRSFNLYAHLGVEYGSLDFGNE